MGRARNIEQEMRDFWLEADAVEAQTQPQNQFQVNESKDVEEEVEAVLMEEEDEEEENDDDNDDDNEEELEFGGETLTERLNAMRRNEFFFRGYQNQLAFLNPESESKHARDDLPEVSRPGQGAGSSSSRGRR